ncbi:MAG: WYL domain-containing protein [Bacteroidaceae bacterium]|nr:WYL domain-containing protein [Bacteroidaceae bacterium]
MSNLKRHIWLIETIQRFDYITLEDLQFEWDHSGINDKREKLNRRTFFNDKNAIEDLFQIEIKYVSGKGYHIPENDAEGFNMARIQDRLISSLSLSTSVQDPQIRRRIQIQRESDGLKHMNAVLDSMKKSVTINIIFKEFYETDYRTIEVEPYGLKFFDHRWYLVGPSVDSNQIRLYSLDKIKSIEQTNNSFVYDNNFRMDAFFNDYYGVVLYEENKKVKPEFILLKVWEREIPYFRSLPLHHSQQEVKKSKSWSLFSYYMAPTWDIERRLLQCNDHVEVIEPQSLRNQMIEHAENITRLYAGEWDDVK